MFNPCTVVGSAFCISAELDCEHLPSKVEHAAEISRWELWHRSWGKRSRFSSGILCESCCGFSTAYHSHQAELGLCRNPWMWPIQENVQSLSLFKAKQELFLKESCSQTPVWWLLAETPVNLQLLIAGHTRWAYSFLLPQELRIPEAPVGCCCSPHMTAVTFPYSARPKSLFQQCCSLVDKMDLASTSSQSWNLWIYLPFPCLCQDYCNSVLPP